MFTYMCIFLIILQVQTGKNVNVMVDYAPVAAINSNQHKSINSTMET